MAWYIDIVESESGRRQDARQWPGRDAGTGRQVPWKHDTGRDMKAKNGLSDGIAIPIQTVGKMHKTRYQTLCNPSIVFVGAIW